MFVSVPTLGPFLVRRYLIPGFLITTYRIQDLPYVVCRLLHPTAPSRLDIFLTV